MTYEQSLTNLPVEELWGSPLKLEGQRGNTPFSSDVIEFLADLSRSLLGYASLKRIPDLAALGYWCRRSNVQAIKARYDTTTSFRLGRGVIFHITPSNVPLNFAYSFIFSLLAGNANLVKIPSKPFEQIGLLLGVFQDLFSRDHFVDIGRRSCFIRFEPDQVITASLSAISDGRIIWGGNETVKAVRTVGLPPRAVEICFPDRYSFSIIKAEKLADIGDKDLRSLTDRFVRDAMLFDQNACSSPRLVCWLSNVADTQLDYQKSRFWSAVYVSILEYYHPADIDLYTKFTDACGTAMQSNQPVQIKAFGNFLYVMNLDTIVVNQVDLPARFGTFFQCHVASIGEALEKTSARYQTLTYFGFDSNELQSAFKASRPHGIDRVVPIGSALNMDIIWDGFDMIQSLTRVVDFH